MVGLLLDHKFLQAVSRPSRPNHISMQRFGRTFECNIVACSITPRAPNYGIVELIVAFDKPIAASPYTGCAKKFYPLRFSDNFSETAENF